MKKPIQWQKADEIADTQWTKNECAWLTHPGSLTRRLREITHGKIEHRIFREVVDVPQVDECEILGISNQAQLPLREIDWWYEEKLWVAARVVFSELPPALAKIGERSLGELLFANPRTKRGELEFAKITKENVLFDRVEKHIPASVNTVWIRRSIFQFDGIPLLVSEIFLPSLFAI